MVVVIILGVLSTIAVLGISRTTYTGTPRMYAERIAAQVDAARYRATAKNRWQRLEVLTSGAVTHSESDDRGMVNPLTQPDWNLVRELVAPPGVEITSTAAAPTTTLPGNGVYAGQPLYISPGGSSLYPGYNIAGYTFFVRDDQDQRHSRIVVYPATATAYVFEY
jgi:hypothetical protein